MCSTDTGTLPEPYSLAGTSDSEELSTCENCGAPDETADCSVRGDHAVMAGTNRSSERESSGRWVQCSTDTSGNRPP